MPPDRPPGMFTSWWWAGLAVLVSLLLMVAVARADAAPYYWIPKAPAHHHPHRHGRR